MHLAQGIWTWVFRSLFWWPGTTFANTVWFSCFRKFLNWFFAPPLCANPHFSFTRRRWQENQMIQLSRWLYFAWPLNSKLVPLTQKSKCWRFIFASFSVLKRSSSPDAKACDGCIGKNKMYKWWRSSYNFSLVLLQWRRLALYLKWEIVHLFGLFQTCHFGQGGNKTRSFLWSISVWEWEPLFLWPTCHGAGAGGGGYADCGQSSPCQVHGNFPALSLLSSACDDSTTCQK